MDRIVFSLKVYHYHMFDIMLNVVSWLPVKFHIQEESV